MVVKVQGCGVGEAYIETKDLEVWWSLGVVVVVRGGVEIRRGEGERCTLKLGAEFGEAGGMRGQ